MKNPTESSMSNLIFSLRQITESAALAASEWIGRGDKINGDRAAVDAMRSTIQALGLNGVVVIGEGEKDEAPLLYQGEAFGDAESEGAFDIAVDPVEGTGYLAKGMTNAMAVIAMAPRGTLFDPGPAFYMEKFAAAAEARGKIDPGAPLEDRLKALGRALGKKPKELTVYVLEKPRHRELVERIHKLGARVELHPAGDVAGALMAAMPESGIDALIGTGGTPEGVISACAIRAMGGEFMGRLDPQLPTEINAVREAGLETDKWHTLDDLVKSDAVYFCATGITTGMLFEGVNRENGHSTTQTLMISGATEERLLLTTYHTTQQKN